MSNSMHAAENGEQRAPRAVIHKKILDVADTKPAASTSQLAAEVSGASKSLVEQVLDEYGDPSEESSNLTHIDKNLDNHDDCAQDPECSKDNESADEVNGHSANTQSTEQTSEAQIDPEVLTDEQLETFRAILKQPSATQRELAEILGISSAAVNKRVNSVDGFEWSSREEFVENLLDPVKLGTDAVEKSETDTKESFSRFANRLKELTTRINDLEGQTQDDQSSRCSMFTDPNLAHKVIHACMQSEIITEDEELEILKHVTGTAACEDQSV